MVDVDPAEFLVGQAPERNQPAPWDRAGADETFKQLHSTLSWEHMRRCGQCIKIRAPAQLHAAGALVLPHAHVHACQAPFGLTLKQTLHVPSLLCTIACSRAA